MARDVPRTVGDYVELQRGTTYKGSLVGQPGPALLGLGSIEPGGGFKHEGYKTYAGDCPASQVLFPGDLYVALKGATKDGKMIGSVARVPPGVSSGRLTQDTVKLTFRRHEPEYSSYLYWILRTPDYRGYCAGRAMGSAVVALSRQDFLNYPVPPITGERKQLVVLLDAFERKTVLIHQMSKTLEATATALFQSWFSELHPKHTKAADLIAEGVLEIGDGYRAKNDELGEPGLPFIRAADLNNGFDTEGADRLRENSMAKAGTKTSRVHDVAFTSKGTIGRFARVGETTEPFVYSPQVCFWRSLDKSRLHPAVLYCWMQSEDFRAQLMAVAGQTDMAPYVSLRDQRQMEVPVFPESQAEIGERIQPFLARQALNMAESRTLAALRDTLLPRLVSGELRIEDPERFLRGTAK